MQKYNLKFLLLVGALCAQQSIMSMSYFCSWFTSPQTRQCSVCTCDTPWNEFFTFDCKHSFCHECIVGNLDNLISKKVAPGSLICMSSGCSRAITEADFDRMLSFAGDQVRSIRKTLLERRNNGVQVRADIVNGADYQENERILKKGFASCPRCNAPVQRTDGCNHMTCKNENNKREICNHQFCYLCLNPWSGHPTGYYSCNGTRAWEADVLKPHPIDDPRNPAYKPRVPSVNPSPAPANAGYNAPYQRPVRNNTPPPPRGGSSLLKKCVIACGCIGVAWVGYKWLTDDSAKKKKAKRLERLRELAANKR